MTGRLTTKNGIIYCVLSYKDTDGTFKQKWITTGLSERGNKKAAQAFLQQKIAEYSTMYPDNIIPKKIEKKAMSKNQILWIDWLIRYIKSIADTLSPVQRNVLESSFINTFEEYWGDSNLLLIDVKTKNILDFYEHLKATRNVKNNTLRRYATVIRPALKKAFKEKLISENPYDYMPVIKRDKVFPHFYDEKDMERFFDAIKGHKLELAFKFLAYYGLRRSELIGIRWDSIDFTNKTITINHKVLVVKRKIIVSETMKTASSTRTLPLIPKIEKELLKHKAQTIKNKEYFNRDYHTQYEKFVFVNELGDLILPDNLTHSFKKIIKKNGLKDIRLHDLRHSCASIMLANGVQMKQIQEWLGHSNFSTTADVYSHLDFSAKIDSANKIANALSGNKRIRIEDDIENNTTMLGTLKLAMKTYNINSIEELLELIKTNKQ